MNRTISIFFACTISGCISLGFHGVPEMEEKLVEDNDGDYKIAVVEIAGEMHIERNQHGGFPFGGASDNIVGRTKEQLDLAADDEDVKAVIVRISSPGGQVYPSFQIHRELLRFRQESGKPVIAYVPDVAASGGYLAAVGSDEIVADDSAITGSIGVLFMLPEVTGLMKFIGVKVNVFKAGERKDTGNPFREMTDEERGEILKFTNYYHAKFKELVDKGRENLDAGQVEAIADGRVFTAPEALEAGLVDAVGDLALAHERAAERAGLSVETTNLVIYRRPGTYDRNLFAMKPTQVGGVQLNLDSNALIPRPQFLFLWQPGL